MKVLMDWKQNILLVCEDCRYRTPCDIPKSYKSQQELLQENNEKLNKQLMDSKENVIRIVQSHRGEDISNEIDKQNFSAEL